MAAIEDFVHLQNSHHGGNGHFPNNTLLFKSLVMETRLLIPLYIISFFQASGARQNSSVLDCLYDSFETVICTWIPVKNATKGQCQLTASVEYGKPPTTCQMNGTSIRSCKLILEDYSLTIVDTIFFVVSCYTGEKWTEIHNQTMKPFQNIQLQPPCNFQLANAHKPSYNLTWTLCVVSHYLHEKLEYEIRYRATSHGENDTILPIIQDQKWLVLENLSPDTVFEAAIRVKVKQMKFYNSVWSRWSMPPLRWRTDPKGCKKSHEEFLISILFQELLGQQATSGIYKSKCDIMVMCWVRIELGKTQVQVFLQTWKFTENIEPESIS
ncbi:PREDICTED: interleukin-2 receptor subunit beta [Thamnophis sirtalis]|uniref:Interleukin-2 receptor subunit beta n=1 Tax=Thamnophis sirtalis TaxID=35019 RepID=A0A6I9Z190_9SAUR|nr:PREDICTED: interleukin-2 receptor subunit beta [Thamnophis sirtalis]